VATYYYIAASLPMIVSPEQELPMSSDDFLEVCRRFMVESDYTGLANSTLEPDGADAPGMCRTYRSWGRSRRDALVRLRAASQKLDPAEYLRESESVFGTSGIAAHAMAASTPLEAEIYLDNQRWQYIDELSMGHFFDIEFLRGYRMKLLLLERRAKFEEERGFAAYRDLYTRVLNASGGRIG
jgi:hypothetical protein